MWRGGRRIGVCEDVATIIVSWKAGASILLPRDAMIAPAAHSLVARLRGAAFSKMSILVVTVKPTRPSLCIPWSRINVSMLQNSRTESGGSAHTQF
jgi:hypothetical protein